MRWQLCLFREPVGHRRSEVMADAKARIDWANKGEGDLLAHVRIRSIYSFHLTISFSRETTATDRHGDTNRPTGRRPPGPARPGQLHYRRGRSDRRRRWHKVVGELSGTQRGQHTVERPDRSGGACPAPSRQAPPSRTASRQCPHPRDSSAARTPSPYPPTSAHAAARWRATAHACTGSRCTSSGAAAGDQPLPRCERPVSGRSHAGQGLRTRSCRRWTS